MSTVSGLRASLISHGNAMFLGITAAGVLLLFLPALEHEISAYDDPVYVSAPEHVRQGISWEGVSWAFSTGHTGYPHPLTWLSLMLDTSLLGPHPASYRLVNILLHLVNAILVFTLLKRCLPHSFFIPAISTITFAWHPSRLESVIWIAERKDVLSTALLLLTLLGYFRWQRNRTFLGYLLLVLMPSVLAILSKPSAVVIPPLLMLMDLWPLRRIQFPEGASPSGAVQAIISGIARILPEKAPLFIVALAWGAITYSVADSSSINADLVAFPIEWRILYLPVTYGLYIQKFFLPFDLSILHLHPFHALPPAALLPGMLALLAPTALALHQFRRDPGILVCWLWFLGFLLPVSGLLQNGMQIIAYRYTYAAYIGLSTAVLLAIRSVCLRFSLFGQNWAAFAAFAWAALLGILTGGNLANWRNDLAIWTHALSIEPWNYVAQGNLASACLKNQLDGEAEIRARIALDAAPEIDTKRLVLASSLSHQRRYAEAETEFARASHLLEAAPFMALERARNLVALGKRHEALDIYAALCQHQNAAIAGVEYGVLLREQGDLVTSRRILETRLAQDTADYMAAIQLALTLILIPETQNTQRALHLCSSASELEQQPAFYSSLARAFILAKSGNIAEANALTMALAQAPLPALKREALRNWERQLSDGDLTAAPAPLGFGAPR